MMVSGSTNREAGNGKSENKSNNCAKKYKSDPPIAVDLIEHTYNFFQYISIPKLHFLQNRR